MKTWADAFQRFIWRMSSSFFLTYIAINFELGMFRTAYDKHELVCVFWQGYVVAIGAMWLCFYLLLFRTDQHEVE